MALLRKNTFLSKSSFDIPFLSVTLSLLRFNIISLFLCLLDDLNSTYFPVIFYYFNSASSFRGNI